MTDPVDIIELRALLEKATPGPWVIARPEQKGEDWPHGIIVAATARGLGIYASGDTATFPSADRAMIAAARNALPALLDEIEALKHDNGRYVTIASDLATEIERLREALRNAVGYLEADDAEERPDARNIRRKLLLQCHAALGSKP